MNLFVSPLNIQTIKTEISEFDLQNFTSEQINVIQTAEGTIKIVNTFQEIIIKIQEKLQQETFTQEETSILLQLSATYNYIKQLIEMYTFFVDYSLENTIENNNTVFNYFNTSVKFIYDSGFRNASVYLIDTYNPTKILQFCWKNIFEMIEPFSSMVSSGNFVVSVENNQINIDIFSSVIECAQKLVACYKELCSSMDNMWKILTENNIIIQQPSFYIFDDIVYPFGILIGTHSGTASFMNSFSNKLYSGIIYKTVEPEIPHLSTLVLKTNTEQNNFISTDVGKYRVSLTNIGNIEIGHYAIIGNIYCEPQYLSETILNNGFYDPESEVSQNNKRYCEYGRIVQIFAETKEIIIEGSLNIKHYGHPSVIIFSMPQEIASPPKNVYSVSYTVIYKTQWEYGQLFCNRLLTPNAFHICSIYTWMPNHYVAYKNNTEEFYSVFSLDVDKLEYNYPANSFVVFYETDVTRLYTTSGIWYDQLLFTSSLSTNATVGVTVLSMVSTKENISTIVEKDCLLSVCGSNGVQYYEIDNISGTTITLQETTPIKETFENGTLIHIIYIWTMNPSLPSFNNSKYKQKTMPEGSIFSGLTTAKNGIAKGSAIIEVENASNILPGYYLSIDNGILNEFANYIISVNPTTNIITLSAPVKENHELGCVIQHYYMNGATIPNKQYYVGLKTIKWKYNSLSFSVVSSAGSVFIALSDAIGITKGLVGVLCASSSSATPEYIQVVEVDSCCSFIHINKPLQFNYPEYYGIQFFSLPKLIQQTGVCLQNILYNTQPTSVGGNLIVLNKSADLQPGQIMSIDSYGTTELTTIQTTNVSSTPNTIQIIPPFNFPHPINSTLVTYQFVIPSVPIGTTKIDQKKNSEIMIQGSNQLFLTNSDGIDINTYLLIGYSDYQDANLKIMEINNKTQPPSIFLDNSLTKNYYTNTLCQFYKYPNLINTSQQTARLTHTYNTERILSGSTTFNIENTTGIRIGSLLQIGKNECKIVDDYYENTIIVNTPFSRTFERNTIIQLYVDNVPILPKDSQLITTTFTRTVAMSGDSSIVLDKFGLCVPNETRILLGSPPFVETCVITQVNYDTTPAEIILDSPLQHTHSSGVVAQLFKYKDVPKGSLLKLRTTITQEVENGSFILYFDSSTLNTLVGIPLFLQIGSGETLEKDLSIVNISSNFVEISLPFKYDHPVDSSVSVYSYSALPSNTGLVTLLELKNPIYIGAREICVDKVKDFRIGMNYCIQVGTGTNVDTDISVISVNLTSNTILVSQPFAFNHPKGTTIQVYVKGLPEPYLPFSNTNTFILEENVESGAIALSVSCINGITVGMYGLIDIGDVVEHFIVLDVADKKISINLQMSYAHKAGSVIQFFNAIHPPDTLLINYKNIYEMVRNIGNGTANSLEISQDVEYLLRDNLIFYKEKWEEMYPSSTDAIILLNKLITLLQSRCLTFMFNQTTSQLSAYIPYYTTIQYYYKELTNITKYNPIPKVKAIWHIIQEIITDILPIVDNSNATNIKNLIIKIQMIYSIYNQLYISQLRLESYLKSVNIKVLPATPHLNNTDFLVLPTTELSFGCLIGGTLGGIGIINEPGTIYNKPYVKNNKLNVDSICLQKEKTRQGDKIIELKNLSGGITTESVIVIDVGIAQETREVLQINGTVIVLDRELIYPHNEDSKIFICSKSKPINFVLNEFTSDFRLIENMEILSEKYDIPTSTFMAYGNIDIELFRNTFLFGTTHLNEFIEEVSESSDNTQCKTYRNIQRKTMGFYVDSSSWNDEDHYQPKLDFSKLKCKSGYYNTLSYVSEVEPDLSTIQTSTLVYNIFNIVDGIAIVSNMNQVITSIKYTFSKYIWNSVYGTILWTQDYHRKPLETIIVDNQNKQNVNFSNENLVEDPLNPGMYFIPFKEDNGSITQKLFSQLTGGDITRLRTAKKYKGTSNVYHFPFIEGDTIVFKVNVKYAMNNVEYILDSQESPAFSQEMIDLNERFNEGKIEHLDFNSYTVILTLV